MVISGRTIVLCVIALLFACPAIAGEESKTETQTVGEWLVLGPLAAPAPAFSGEDDEFKPADLLAYRHVDIARLSPGSSVPVARGGKMEWKRQSADGGAITIPNDGPAVAYLAAYVSVRRWTKAEFEVDASHAFELFVEGQSVVTRDAEGDDTKTGSAKLIEGKHLIIVKTAFTPGDDEKEWTVGVRVKASNAVEVSTNPARTMTIGDVLDGPSVTNLSVSPDGAFFAASMQRRHAPEGETDSWVDIRQVRDGRLIRALRDVSGSMWTWAPVKHRLSYVTRDDGAATLRVIDIDNGTIETILEDVPDFSNYLWAPDGTFIVYSVNKKPDDDKTGVQRLRRISDRRAGDRNRSSLYITSVPAGATRRLTAGNESVQLYDIHPDGKTLLVGRSQEDVAQRPYSKEEVYRLDINTLGVEVLWEGSWLGVLRWSPDGRRILATGGPSAFGDAGRNVPEGVIPNDYDTQAYIFDPGSKTVDPITKNFNPRVVAAYWPKSSKDIFFVAEDGEFVRLFRYDRGKKTFKRIDIDCDVVRRRGVADDRAVAVVTGVKANRPARLYAVDLEGGRARELFDPAGDRFENVRIGEVRDFDFETSDGRTIVGRVHLPPDFDASKKWPCIVYYYGGTAPVTRSFGGRYPLNLWAAHGYVVYVPQPSGATGFGQAFSAMHVNDWGKVVSDEIIEGTKKFLAAHEFVDPHRVGCIGASFGGFMTMLLVTRTDIFAAAVSHAGISMISSYWGEGYWGYGYNSVSAANSFPWNRRDIYVDQSPLFGVENVTTPLLLLHGTSDHNVPPGESEQMYTALKLLGKEVEYIRVEGQDHWILDYKKRIVWNDAIISWFDRWLKGEPEWWNDAYPPLTGAAAEAE